MVSNRSRLFPCKLTNYNGTGISDVLEELARCAAPRTVALILRMQKNLEDKEKQIALLIRGKAAEVPPRIDESKPDTILRSEVNPTTSHHHHGSIGKRMSVLRSTLLNRRPRLCTIPGCNWFDESGNISKHYPKVHKKKYDRRTDSVAVTNLTEDKRRILLHNHMRTLKDLKEKGVLLCIKKKVE